VAAAFKVDAEKPDLPRGLTLGAALFLPLIDLIPKSPTW
jgi:hypothetical protein